MRGTFQRHQLEPGVQTHQVLQPCQSSKSVSTDLSSPVHPDQNVGRVDSGIGGGASSSAAGVKCAASPGFFLGGGGGGFFFPAAATTARAPPPTTGLFGVCGWLGGWLCSPFRRSVTPYLLFKPPAVFMPLETCSPCRCRKLLAVDAAERASDMDTVDGSFRNDDAVFRAACFCAHVVPVLSPACAAAGCFELPSFEKRFCSSLTCAFDDAGAGAAGSREGDGAGGVGPWLRIPNAGTDTPAAPRRFTAP